MSRQITFGARSVPAVFVALGCSMTVGAGGSAAPDAAATLDLGDDLPRVDRGVDAPRPGDVGDAMEIGLPPGSISCGDAVCARGEVCVACAGEALRCYPRAGEPNQRADCQFRAYCDTDDDCPGEERCLWVEGDFENFRCGVRGDVVCRISLPCHGDAECAPCFGQPQRCVDPLAAYPQGRGLFPRVCRR